MGHKLTPGQAVHRQVPVAFAFLAADAGCTGPELTTDERFQATKVTYHRPGLYIETCLYDTVEPCLVTSLAAAPRGYRIALDELYVALSLGPAQHVPEGVGNVRLTLKRIDQHALALRRTLPCLPADLDAFIRRHRGLPPAS